MGASGNQPVQNAFQGASQAMQQAGQTYGNLAGFQAPTAQAAQIGPVGSLATANMQQYMSPYTEQVIQRGQQDIMRQQQQGMNQLGAQATAAKAFGGSRHGVAEGVAAGEYGRMAGDFAAQQREKAYQQALGAAQYDIGQQQQRALQQANLQQQAEPASWLGRCRRAASCCWRSSWAWRSGVWHGSGNASCSW